MEAKTIGKFITALRKANGMTQKDLAEKLNVSDKTISRWERDEGAPDLSMIPVIAEIFDVTCDELLRGERKSPAEREAAREAATDTEENAATAKEEFSAKSEKQLKRLLKVTLSQFKNRTYIALGLSILGIIVALICNLAFLKAMLGGLLGMIFYAAGIICQFIFKNRAGLSVEDSGIEEESLAAFKRNTIRLTEKSIGFTVACFGFTFPLFLVNDSYLGLAIESLLEMGLIGIGIALIIYIVILFFFNASLVEKGNYPLEEKQADAFRHNHKLLGRCALVLALLIFLTYNLQQVVADPYRLQKGTVYNDYESFVTYMEQDIPRTYQFIGNDFTGNNMYVTERIPDSTIYYDEFGNETSADEALRRTLLDKNGNVVCEFIQRNGDVNTYDYTPGDGTALPITVYTYEDLFFAKSRARDIKAFFLLVYLLELAAVVLFYRKKSMK
ncbi:MAG: helix-turn-helix transcriptional regulator [Lachnospiraceae bacterium]|nr:helix-turn-helix transcriptional regulator [Lachnospiraceae bacterium]MBP3593147.1 helix-turn-helix transcriptional regulator [Lachnospiraceae bacterium]